LRNPRRRFAGGANVEGGNVQGGPRSRAKGSGSRLDREGEAAAGGEAGRGAFRNLGLPQLPHVQRHRGFAAGSAEPDRRGSEEQGDRLPDRPPQVPQLREQGLADAVVRGVRRGELAQDRHLPRGVQGREVGDAAVRIFLGITGASGAPYASRLVQALVDADAEVGICISRAGYEVLATELYRDVSLPQDEIAQRLTGGAGGVTIYGERDWNAPYASGSAKVDAYVVC